MAEIIGVRFKTVGKVYYFAANGIQAQVGDAAIVETARGVECGEVALSNKEIPEEQITAPLKEVIRLATAEDLAVVAKNKKKEGDAFRICEEKIRFRKLDMKLVEVECTFDNSKLLFYFTAENRVDFRELVKDLASVFRTRMASGTRQSSWGDWAFAAGNSAARAIWEISSRFPSRWRRNRVCP